MRPARLQGREGELLELQRPVALQPAIPPSLPSYAPATCQRERGGQGTGECEKGEKRQRGGSQPGPRDEGTVR